MLVFFSKIERNQSRVEFANDCSKSSQRKGREPWISWKSSWGQHICNHNIDKGAPVPGTQLDKLDIMI